MALKSWHQIASRLGWSRLRQFAAWRFYRTRLVPLLLFIALLSIVFRGASLSLEGELERIDSTLFWGIAGASLIMTMHAGYLMLMSYHLVYRFPIEKIQIIGLAILPITAAYVLYAIHDYAPHSHSHILGQEALSAGAFMLGYLLMASHGLHDYREHHGQMAPGLTHQPNRQRRQKWMLGTDLALCGLAIFVFVETLHWLPFELPSRPQLTTLPSGPLGALGFTLLRKTSLEDVLILAALILYALGKYAARKQFDEEKSRRHKEVQGLHKVAAIGRLEGHQLISLTPATFQQALPPKENWLDVGNLQDVFVKELVGRFYPDESKDAPRVTFLHQTEIGSGNAVRKVRNAQVIHMAHAAYTPKIARQARRLFKHCQTGTRLLARYTADASLYRAISSATACAAIFPYTYHAVHPLLLEDLEDDCWEVQWRAFIVRTCDISTPDHVQSTVDWCDAQYGEFSGEVIRRYLEGFFRCGYTSVPNWDVLVLLTKN